jgi:curved DNA-binding protein CbpA
LRAVRTYYEILGVEPTASAAELRTAYRRLLRQAHPDMGGSSALLDLVNEAYDALKEPAKRSQYDAALRQGTNTTGPGSTGPRPPPSRAGQSHEPPPAAPFGQYGNSPGAASGTTAHTGVPRSPSGRVPQWVIDEALGQTPRHAVPWRGTYASALAEQRRSRGPRRGTYASALAEQRRSRGPQRSRGRRRWSEGFIWALVVLGVFGAAAWLQANGTLKPGVNNTLTSRPANWPSPGREEAAHPLGVPAPLAKANASYRFVAHQTDGTTPVAYDPCRPIHYVIRRQGEPASGHQIVTDAVLRVSQATGLRFVYDGATSEAPSRQRQLYQPDRYGDRWAPVLISWVTPNENPDFAADVTGAGGSAHTGLPNQPSAYVSGAVELDAGQLTSILQRPDGNRVVRAVVLHELGHLVGLDHVTAANQLMYPQSQPGVTDFGAGDLNGLAALGRGTCLPDL